MNRVAKVRPAIWYQEPLYTSSLNKTVKRDFLHGAVLFLSDQSELLRLVQSVWRVVCEFH